MPLAPWRSPLSRALHRNRSLVYARYLQLATVRADGRPANRTLVFRGFLDDSNQLKFVTDSRSEKADQIQHQTWGEICWYFPSTREQFRLAGELTLVGQDFNDGTLTKARQTIWQELSDVARLQFAWAHPGKSRLEDDAFSPPSPDLAFPLPNFCLLLLNPEQVDHLELRGDPQNRYLYLRDQNQEWSSQSVNP
ncbi:pyridoxamine 5'-phosphate oxidase family protein [Leptolyngbya sp. FACHB-671]|uniref:Npun_F5749 family FMN-dependent PPOX-type flavoprotein n=1 Tax=Leptolyngbya sp. FACHB-671 TaxID=2692812 RepID=UPI001685F5D0|nr:Npun_F5749 family FMN-dependent PPOX-type flavoprotein [Leptolyngbya sp. FACHB-671]MBD2071837.1 pyridoxamine 5'-phosphate oxidase family protein [Leptolyngbya sp. FACHB-671]